ncbi:AAA family ATPase [Candidatus Poriferisodalis sp.]|uniref:AAA family ATPase n=1 Tax=Candidatus Poriferisodalis sp. TaxID=3101277 RepID=UPI003B018048
MKLKSFRVGPYRNILDSDQIAVDPEVTVLVGKNESGKTNLLQALHSLKSATESQAVPRLDYPRWLQKAHERSGEYSAARPIEVVFSLTEDEQQAVADRFGDGVLLGGEFRAYRAYESPQFRYVPPECDTQAAIKHLVSGVQVEAGDDLGALRERLEEQGEATDPDGELLPESEAAAAAVERLDDVYGEHETVRQAVGKFVCAFMPSFFYFDDFAQLPGTTDTAPLVAAIRDDQTPQLDDNQRTALALLRMGFADEEIVAKNYDIRKAELQAVGASLTHEVLKYWKQNPHLRLMIDINPVAAQGPNGEQIVRRELKLDVMDDRHHFTNSLDARSSGFRWFVSFIAAFAEFEDDSNVIVLLDEPGLGLHARAQDDFLRFIDDRLAKRHQVIFTTHSPFLVDPTRLDRVRVVEDAGPEDGARVTTTDGASKDPDTLFPLQAALGYDIAQNLFVGPDNLVVEGLSDFTYLTVMSDCLKSNDRAGLNERWRILPAGGASNIPTFVTLVGRSLDVTVLVDGGQSSSQRIRNLIKAGLLDDKRLVTPNAGTSTKSADIEDLFTDGDYLMIFNGAHPTNLKVGEIKGDDRIAKRIERASDSFDHNAPARYLLENRSTVLPKFSKTTLDRFESLFVAINQTLSDA